MNTPDRDLTEEEIKQAARHYCALYDIDPDEVWGGEPAWENYKTEVVSSHNWNRVLQKVYQDAERKESK